jgi:hypothetical protein
MYKKKPSEHRTGKKKQQTKTKTHTQTEEIYFFFQNDGKKQQTNKTTNARSTLQP